MKRNNNTIRIENIGYHKYKTKQVVECNIDLNGYQRRIVNEYYNFKGRLYVGVEGFISLILPYAINENIEIETKYTVDKTYYDNIKNILKKYEEWNPQKNINLRIHAPIKKKKLVFNRPNRKSLCSFTGGVDSFFTLIENNNSIGGLMYVQNFDVFDSQNKLLDSVLKMVRSVSQKYNKQVIICNSNIRKEFPRRFSPYFGWGKYLHGPALMCLAYPLSPTYKHYFIPGTGKSSISMQWGSSHHIDHHNSSSFFYISHSGDHDRYDKLKIMLGKDTFPLEHLKVCYKNKNQAYNCSKCEKCYRTIICIYLLGYKDKMKTFDQNVDPKKFLEIQLGSHEYNRGRYFQEKLARIYDELHPNHS